MRLTQKLDLNLPGYTKMLSSTSMSDVNMWASMSEKIDPIQTPCPVTCLQRHQKSALIRTFATIYEKRILPPLEDRVKTKYIDNTVEINGINIERRFAADAVDYADITNMSIEFFVDTGFSNRICDGQRIKISSLNPIVDDTGKLLLTKNRRQGIYHLAGYQRARGFNTKRDGRSGVNFSIRLDAPAIGAKKNAVAFR